jgi:uncharacterized heparinase superfamily protein
VAASLSEVGWDGSPPDKLWRYNQHYFDDLSAERAADRRDWHASLIATWIAGNAPGKGVGWDPYPTSLRIVNWIKWAAQGNVLPAEAIASLAIQVRWLADRLEFHLLGNHLLSNAKALTFAGLFFEGSESASWLRRGLSLVNELLNEHVLSDGGHFERSTMYHSLCLEDVLDLCNIAECYEDLVSIETRNQWRCLAARMARWMNIMAHPDREISFFNDAAFGIAPSPSALDEYVERLGVGVEPAEPGEHWLQESGYMRVSHNHSCLLMDVAPIGPDYLPGHAHADTLSFEWSLFGHRVFVNSGTSVYGTGPERLRQRGTPAHNTVTINGTDSSEVWGGFRVARRAYVTSTHAQFSSMPRVVTAAHNGYTRLVGKPIHTRTWALGQNDLSIKDSIGGRFDTAVAYFHIHPAVMIEVTDSRRGSGRLPDGKKFTWVVEHGSATIEQSTWHPRFGIAVASQCLVVAAERNLIALRVKWS